MGASGAGLNGQREEFMPTGVGSSYASAARAGVGTEPIAIIGIGCRFPGGADSPEAFWELLCDGVDAVTPVPPDRWGLSIYEPGVLARGKGPAQWGGFLDLKAIEAFDALFFGISPREAGSMDPQQRLLLEVAWEALEDAGQVAADLHGSRTGVFLGMSSCDYENIRTAERAPIDIYSLIGSARSVHAGRLSYAYGLEGPSLVTDTACSSSLVACHLASQSLRNRECALALAAGVNLVLLPELSSGFNQADMMAPDGRCKAFDARADGFVRSEGVAVVVLKRLSDAVADSDPIYAVIRGSAVNNDGRSSGLLITPGQRGQEAVLREAYRHAGVLPGHVQYVEAHGTGTSVGDPVEARALGRVIADGRPPDRPCLVGSVKTNIGHAEATAGP
jgi:acyl transferase domain-containing protein